MYVDDPRDLGLGLQGEDERRDARTTFDEQETLESNRPRTALYDEGFDEE